MDNILLACLTSYFPVLHRRYLAPLSYLESDNDAAPPRGGLVFLIVSRFILSYLKHRSRLSVNAHADRGCWLRPALL